MALAHASGPNRTAAPQAAARPRVSVSEPAQRVPATLPACQACTAEAPCPSCGGQASGYFGNRLGSAGLGDLLTAGAIHAKLEIGSTSDPVEREADKIADAVTAAAPCHSQGSAGCPACQGKPETVRRRAETASPASTVPSGVASVLAGAGQGLDAATRAYFEPRFGRDLRDVRVHTDATAAQSARSIGAHAYAAGQHIAFGPGAYAPGTATGRRLLAHELAHTLQPNGETGGNLLRRSAICSITGPPQSTPDSEPLVRAVGDGDVGAVVGFLRGKAIPELCALRATVLAETGQSLEGWLMGRLGRAGTIDTATGVSGLALGLLGPVSPVTTAAAVLHEARQQGGSSAEEGLRLLWPSLPLIDRLELYDEGWREIEQAQLDVIRAASASERVAVQSETARLDAVYSHMDNKEEYQARLLIDPEHPYVAAERVLTRAPGVFSGDADLVFDAIWALSPADRRRFFYEKKEPLQDLLMPFRFPMLQTLVSGTEAEALIARLREATEGRIDDQEAIRATVDRAIALINEQKQVRATLAITELPADERAIAQARLEEIGDLEGLLRYGDGKLDSTSFLGRLADAANSPDAFGATAQRLGATISDPEEQRKFYLRTAKQRILMAAGTFGADEDAIRNAIIGLRAPPVIPAAGATPAALERQQTDENNRLRQLLMDDPEVKAVLDRLTTSEEMRVRGFVTANSFVETVADLTVALNGARWGEFFRIVLQIANRPDWLARFRATSTDPFGTYARVFGEPREIMQSVLDTGKIPIDRILAYTGDVEMLRMVLAALDEQRRGQLRLGYLLAQGRRAAASDDDRAALAAYQTFEEQLKKSQTTLGSVDRAGIENVLDAALGSEPTAQELGRPAGRYDAAALMYEREQAHLSLGRGLGAVFTETDETMVAAGREFAAQWLVLRDRMPHELTTVEFAALSALHDRFNSRAEEFGEAVNKIGEIAGMIAATVAGIIVVAATGGVTAPAVIAAAAAGAGARVVTREMIGEDYYTAASAQGARDAFLGALDGALAVVGASLGARGAELVGLSGHALLSTVARIGGEVAEQAGTSLGRRVSAGAVQAAIDGAFSGAVSQAATTMTDTLTWRRGIWSGLVRVGQAALLGGLAGLAAGGVLGAALPVLGAGLRSAADRILGASAERELARAGATETLEAARRAMRAGDTDEARRLFSEIEQHLSPEQANLVWRDLSLLAENAARLEEPITLLGERHTLRVVQGEQGSFFMLCTWCTRVRDIIRAAREAAQAEGRSTGVINRLDEMIGQLDRMEANLARGKGSEDVNTLRSLLGTLTESEHLLGSALQALPRREIPNFSQLAQDPAVARRAGELFPGYYDQLYRARRDIFRGARIRRDLQDALEEEAKARSLAQAQRESARGAPFELEPGASARATVDPRVDIPYGFYNRAGFEQFAQRLQAALEARSPGSQLVMEGSSVTGRRFDRLVDIAPTGAPFGQGRLSDYDVAIISDALFRDAQRARIPLQGGSVAETQPLRGRDIAALGLGDLDTAAQQAVRAATGIAYPVKFKIRASGQTVAGLQLPLP